ncbi:MAG: SCP2 sterol-binding domain-containing protein [Lysobacterales bacterium]|jgi:ubiquinone biosynthesis protein UbiJ
MPEYRTPLPGILAAMLESAVNRVLALDDESPQRLERLDGRMLRLDFEGLGLSLFFAFSGERVEVGTESASEPDTVVRGSPLALFSMALPEAEGHWGDPDSRVTITGDANLARDLERLFSRLDPDWEGSIARVFGDVLGYQVAAGLRAGAEQFRESAGSAGGILAEFLARQRKAARDPSDPSDPDETA